MSERQGLSREDMYEGTLLNLLDEHVPQARPSGAIEDAVLALVKARVNDALEEAAKVADGASDWFVGKRIASLIRDLKK